MSASAQARSCEFTHPPRARGRTRGWRRDLLWPDLCARRLSPLFNSAAPVVALAAGVALAARSWWAHVALGAAAGPLAMVGYYGTSMLRGYGVSASMVLMWCVAGVIAGAAVGLAVWSLRGHGPAPMRALGAAVLPTVALGEAAHGVVRISDTTPVAYWWSLAAVGIAVLVWLLLTRVEAVKWRILACATTAVLAGVLFVVYDAAGSL